jgi:homocysteine S-methyltransferase
MTTIEVVPPAGPDPQTVLNALQALQNLTFDAFSVATNPVAKPRMSALALCALIQQATHRPAILHVTTRDHNAISLQALLWGASALGIKTVMLATGDFVALGQRETTTTVRDVDVFQLVRMARDAGLQTGVVLDPHPESDGLALAVERLERKVAAGAQFAVTQPVYDEAGVLALHQHTRHIDIPVILGILPLRTARHAEFLHTRVAGIAIPREVRARMHHAQDTIAEGVRNAREILALARAHFAGACLMPPFDHYEVMPDILM